jgi:hypothetical protein
MRLYLIYAVLTVAILLQGCGEKAPEEASLDFNGIQITLQVPDGVTHQPLPKLLTDLEQELESYQMLDPANEDGLIAQLNREANNKSVSFEKEAFDFILQIMSLGRQTEGLIDLRTGTLASLWFNADSEPDPVLLDSALVHMQSCGFISASSSFLIYGPEATWDTTPLLTAWYAMHAHSWIAARLPQGLLRVGPLYMTIGDPAEYSVELPGRSENEAGRNIIHKQGCLAVLSASAAGYPLVNPLTGQLAAVDRISIVSNQDPLTAQGMALAGLLQSAEAAQLQFEATAIEGLILMDDGSQQGSPELAARLQ